MAGCCPATPTVMSSGVADKDNDIRDNPMMKGESAECYMAVSTNPTGLHDDATGNVPNKILNTTITLDAKGAVDMVFKLQPTSAQGPVPTTDGSSTVVARTPTSWTMVIPDGGGAWARTDVKFTSAEETATFKGQFPDTDFKKPFKVLVTAKDATGDIDSRSFAFSPDKSTGSDSIVFVKPLPGAYVSSPFSVSRFHPKLNIFKPHNGADMSIGPGKTTDVVAAADGEVIFVGVQPIGAGNYIRIKHLNSQGQHLCTTVYMHLAKCYVAENQKVSAGQKIGFEGSTGGISTGVHLHFECRLPNGVAIDPVPYIRGGISVAGQTKSDNTPVPNTMEQQNTNSVLTPANVQAKQASCKPFGPTYPNTESAVPIIPASGDLFTLAWHLTLTSEVGPFWEGTPPTNPSTIAGLIDTAAHIKAVGFSHHPGSGGDTKFGIAADFNRSVVIETMDYETAKNLAYTNFWNGKRPGKLAANANTKRVAVALFDLGYLCGVGGAGTIQSNAGIVASDTELQALNKICDAAKSYLNNKAAIPGKGKYAIGWGRRVETIRSYCTNLVLPT